MRRAWRSAAIPLLVTALMAPAGSVAAASPSPPRFVPNQVLVRFAPQAGSARRSQALRGVGADSSRSLKLPGLRLVEVEGSSVPAAVRALEAEPGVRYAEPNYFNEWAMTPDDDYFINQWGLENTGNFAIGSPPEFGTADADIDAAAAWDKSVGSAKTIIGIADTGIYFSHPDLAGNAYTNPGESGGGKASNGIDDDGNGYVDDFRGYDFFAGDNDAFPANPPAPLDRHGTLVASTAGAQGNNSVGVTGVSQEVSLLPLRVGDAASGPVSANQVLAFRYAGKLGAEVVNLSGGGGAYSQAVRDAIRAAPNTLFVFAAGNGGSDHIGDNADNSPHYPCNLAEPNVVCLAATDQDDKLATFSNYGANSIDLAAPGVNIFAANIGTDVANSYEFVDGTSFAAPMAAGAAAVYRSRYPKATAAQTATALRKGVDKLPSLSGVVKTGGRLNLDHTLDVKPPDESIELDLSAAKRQKLDRLKARVGCGAEACKGKLGGKVVARKEKGGVIIVATGAGKKGRKTFGLKTKRFSLAAGHKRTQRLKFKHHRRTVRKLRKLLRRRIYRGGVKAKVKASASDSAGNRATKHVVVKLRR
jgi:subtilisin family serine protease